jgi:hypothetical protein
MLQNLTVIMVVSFGIRRNVTIIIVYITLLQNREKSVIILTDILLTDTKVTLEGMNLGNHVLSEVSIFNLDF